MITQNGKEIKTFQQLSNALSCDYNSFSGSRYTKYGEFELNGKPAFVYRHWSYEGNYQIYRDITRSTLIGEIVKTGDVFPCLDECGNPVLMHGWMQIYDWNITVTDYEKD